MDLSPIRKKTCCKIAAGMGAVFPWHSNAIKLGKVVRVEPQKY